MQGTVVQVLVKSKSGVEPTSCDFLHVERSSSRGGRRYAPLREVLITSESQLKELDLKAGALKEDVVIDGFDIHTAPSGAVITIGNVKIRLTFHCEPCWKIADSVNMKNIMHRRGYCGQYLNEGKIQIGDTVSIDGSQKYEEIPYTPKDRIVWYLDNMEGKIYATDLVWNIGLSAGYVRALPGILKKLGSMYSFKVMFKGQKN